MLKTLARRGCLSALVSSSLAHEPPAPRANPENFRVEKAPQDLGGTIGNKIKGRKENNKLNFLWPKMARLGPRL